MPWHRILFICCLVSHGQIYAQQSDAIENGKLIYQQGLSRSGIPIIATLFDGQEIPATALNCSSCHRHSGYGASEGSSYVPPITGDSLFRDQQPRRDYLFRSLYQEVQSKPVRSRIRNTSMRKAYSAETLARLLRQGIDPSGRKVLAPMPQYQISDVDLADLISYLKTLGTHYTAAIQEQTIHFASITTPQASESESLALWQVINAYQQRKNNNVGYQKKRDDASLLYKNDMVHAYNYWKIHHWPLHGDITEWPAQLQRYYQSQAIFAVISGVGKTWYPIHEFCQQQGLPCLFPNTDHPDTRQPNHYNLYLYRGLQAEAALMASWLQEQNQQTVLQIVQADASYQDAAEYLKQTLHNTAINVSNISVLANATVNWTDIATNSKDICILWLDINTIPELPCQIMLTSKHLKQLSKLQSTRPGKALLFSWPYNLPDYQPPRTYRLRAWMRSRNISNEHEAIKMNTYFALSVTDHALNHILDRYSRDYLIEVIENETENALNPGVFPSLSLGSGQRFASKQGYILTAIGTKLEPRL